MAETGAERAPTLSVVIPVYNRERLVLRAIKSVLDDPAIDVEVVVVDDASTDGTAAQVANVSDQRLRLVRMPINSGVCSARNRGAREARGEWLIFLDSDDELVSGALNAIRERARAADTRTGKLIFSCRFDSGLVSPEPALDGRTVNYVGFLEYLQSTAGGHSESLPCPRRTAFLECPYPEQRGWLEGLHELDFARMHQVQLCPDVVRLYHADATDRLMIPNLAAVQSRANANAAYADAILASHGNDVWEHAPSRWLLLAREAALSHFFAGHRRAGIRHSVRVLQRVPSSLRTWAVLIGGVISPGLLRRLWTSRRARVVP